jgi:hypothetical protein
VVIPVILATLFFSGAREALRVGCEISIFRKDAFHWAVALSREEFGKR